MWWGDGEGGCEGGEAWNSVQRAALAIGVGFSAETSPGPFADRLPCLSNDESAPKSLKNPACTTGRRQYTLGKKKILLMATSFSTPHRASSADCTVKLRVQ